MLDWFQRLLPRGESFSPLFERHAASIAAAAQALRRMLDGGEAIPGHYRAVMRHEEEADAITREVLLGVRSTFITPFDRGDIKDLITAMDDAIDQMQKTAKVIVLFEMNTFASHALHRRQYRRVLRACGQGDAAARQHRTTRGTVDRDLPADQPHRGTGR